MENFYKGLADDRRTTNRLVFFPKLIFVHDHFTSFRFSVQRSYTHQKKSILASLDFLLYATVAERGQGRGYYLLTSRQF